MLLKFANKGRSEHDVIADKVSAALETGNAGQARMVLAEYKDKYPEHAARLRASCIAEYGVSL